MKALFTAIVLAGALMGARVALADTCSADCACDGSSNCIGVPDVVTTCGDPNGPTGCVCVAGNCQCNTDDACQDGD
jgi:hypothetical protein